VVVGWDGGGGSGRMVGFGIGFGMGSFRGEEVVWFLRVRADGGFVW
jgi:hypothetical protein